MFDDINQRFVGFCGNAYTRVHYSLFLTKKMTLGGNGEHSAI